MKRLAIGVVLPLLLLGVSATSAVARPGWEATVKLESAPLYSVASSTGRVVAILSKGDVVVIGLEIEGADGIWCMVTEAGRTGSTGYVQGACLDREPPADIAGWQFKPPPPPPDEQPVDEKPQLATLVNKTQVRDELEVFFASRFRRPLPVSAFGQTRLHRSMGFDHRNAFDVAVHPDGPEGRAVQDFLRKKRLPFISFRAAKPGAATGPHIHVGRPSPRDN